MTAQQLKNSILQMAVQGKLVPQDPNDEPASVLLERIKKEKQELIKAGKIKKDSKSSEIFRGASRNFPYTFCEQIGKEVRDISDEIPFDIPESWEWVRLGFISTYNEPKQKINAKDADKSIWELDLEDIEKGGRLIAKIKIGERKAVGDKTVFQKGDILYSKLRPYLLKILIATDNGICTPEIVPFTVYGSISSKYIINYLKSPYVDSLVNGETYGIKMPRAGTETMISLLVPLPPLAEQHRIVSKIEELLPYIDKYEQAETQLTALNTTFPEALKKSILQEAVHGKLVPQDPNDEPAIVLLERIRAEKKKLVKEGKIKKDKSESVIVTRDKIPYEIIDGKERCIADEVPFEIPESWCWVRLSDVIDVRDGTHDTPSYIPNGYPLITGKDFYNGYFDLSKTKYISKDDYEEIIKRSKVEIDDILFSMIGGNIGSMITITKDNYFDMAIKNVALFKQYNYNLSISKYLELFLRSQVSNMQSIAKGGAQSFIPLNTLRNYLFPLPPLSEQHRIVAKIEETLPLISEITS